jgi:hypothetical protein
MATRRPLVLVNGVTSELPAGDVVVDASGIAPGSANQVLQTNAGGTATEWRSNVVVPGTLNTAGVAVFASGVGISGAAQFGGTTGKNAMTAGPITVASGVTVTVPSGSSWTVV